MKKIVLIIGVITIIVSCSSRKETFKVKENPVATIAKGVLPIEHSVVLNDMDIEETANLITYKHKYTVLKVIKDSLHIDSTDWKPVNEKYFLDNEKNLGMEILSYHNGKLSDKAQPVGYGWAIGNEKQGKWVKDTVGKNNNRKIWRPSGTSLLFAYWMMRRPSYRSTYNNYDRNYRGRTPFYGRNNRQFGTKSPYQEEQRSGYYARVGRSSSWSNHNKARSKKTSRYNKSSSTRGRSGGYGK